MQYHQIFSPNVNHVIQNYINTTSDLTRLETLSSYIKTLPLFQEVVLNPEHLSAIANLAAQWRSRYQHVMVLGTGGSSSGGQALMGALHHHLHHQIATSADALQLTFIDNIDPVAFALHLKDFDPATTGVIAISKSGNTPETLSQLGMLIAKARTYTNWHDNFLVITTLNDNPLHTIAQHFNLKVLAHHPAVGGRFSVFTNVGMLPAALLGLDINQIVAGAAAVVQATLDWLDQDHHRHSTNISLLPPPVAGALAAACLFNQHQVNLAVLMPYHDNWQGFLNWYRQLWAESLGKNGWGSTPCSAIGTVDQHSQLQLYLDGPKDKLITVIHQTYYSTRLPNLRFEDLPDPRLSFLHDHSMTELMQVESQVTIESLINHQVWVRQIQHSGVTEQLIGQLMMHFILETLATACLCNLNPFDQPAVEHGKIQVKALLKERI